MIGADETMTSEDNGMEKIEIRKLTAEDYDAVYGLWIRTPGMGLNTTDDSRAGFAKFIARNPTSCFAAIAGTGLAGVILAGHDGRRGYIYHLCVDSEFRRGGLARRLVESALDALEREGIQKAALVVFAWNEGGNAFWEKIGFGVRNDLIYRNRSIHELERIDT